MNKHESKVASLSVMEPLVHENQVRLRAFLHARVHDPVAVDDLAQEVFLSAMLHMDQYDPARPVWPWLTGIARNKIREHWRETAREIPSDSIEMLVADREMNGGKEEDAEDHRDRLEALRICMSRLAPNLRRLLDLTYGQSLNSRVLSSKLGQRAGSVRVALFRTRKWLANCIGKRLETVSA